MARDIRSIGAAPMEFHKDVLRCGHLSPVNQTEEKPLADLQQSSALPLRPLPIPTHDNGCRRRNDRHCKR
jgi:hypothetical protein